MKGAIRHIIPSAKRLWKSTHRPVSKMSVGFFVVNLAMGIVLLMAPCTWAKTIHVPADSATIQTGIDGATDGDTVLVADGVYTGEGNKNIDFLGRAIVVRSQNGPEVTIIDCQGDGRGFYFHSGEGLNSRLEGFTIKRGNASYGGGINCSYDTSPSITNCSILGNIAYSGGGISCEDSSPTITSCYVSGNTAHASDHGEALGGGIHIFYASPTIINCTITGNRASVSPPWQGWAVGGGIYCDGSATIINCTISGNSAVYIGGIACGTGPPHINNCIIWNNTGSEISVFDESPIVTYSDVEGGWPGESNIDEDPLFRDPQNDDFHLMVGYCGHMFNSPCIDRGDPTIFDEITDCEHGLGTTRSDMGAYGGSNAGWPTAVEEKEEIVSVPEEFMLLQNYPNPFNSETILSFHLPMSEFVNFHIYNVLGQRLQILVEEFREAGEHSLIWDASDLSSGIYFARLEAGGRSRTIKMVLLR